MSTFKVDNIQSSNTSPSVFKNVNGTEIGQLCKAWINYDGSLTSPITARGSLNMSSVIKNTTGDFTFTFINSLPDINYSVVGSSGDAAGQIITAPWRSSAAPTSSSFKVGVLLYTGTYVNPAQVNLVINR